MNKSVIEDLSSGNLLTNIHVETSNRYYKKQEDTSAPLRNRKTAFLIQKTDFLGQTGSPDPSRFSGGSTGYISKKKAQLMHGDSSQEIPWRTQQRSFTPVLGSAKKRAGFSSSADGFSSKKKKKKSRH